MTPPGSDRVRARSATSAHPNSERAEVTPLLVPPYHHSALSRACPKSACHPPPQSRTMGTRRRRSSSSHALFPSPPPFWRRSYVCLPLSSGWPVNFMLTDVVLPADHAL